jgi:hypothetical protein
MKRIHLVTWIILITVSYSFGQDIDERLTPLKPFLDKIWKGDFKAPDGKIISVITRKFEVQPEKKVIKVLKSNEGKTGWSEGYLYWDDIAKKIAYFSIESSGVFYTGFLSFEGNSVTIEGKMTWPFQQNPKVRQSYEFKNTFEFITDNKMIDSWFQNAFGPWQPGHVIEFNNEK